MSYPAAGTHGERVRDALEDLCRDRPMPEGELAPVNTFYGHGHILRRYAGVEEHPIYAVIPHSPAPDPSFVWDGERLPPVPAVLCYPAHRIAAFEQAASKTVVPAASPYVYVQRLFGGPVEGDRRGTIFFPAHSTHHVTADLQAQRLAETLLAVGEPYAPVTVCLYWRDVQLGRHHPFIERGLEVVSAGHMFDPRFLFRLHELCGRHRYASGSSVGAHIFFATASGCTYVLLPEVDPPPPSAVEGSARTSQTDGVRLPEDVLDLSRPRSIRPTFLVGTPDPVAQREAAGYFLGSEHALEPADLRRLMQRLRRDDKTQIVVERHDGTTETTIPPFWRRLGSRLAGQMRRVLTFVIRILRMIGRSR